MSDEGARSVRSAMAVNALIHLHRAEVNRLTAYRARLDTTTSWAISTSALVATFAFGDRMVPHVAFLFLMLLVYFFLQLESRRFRHYEASRQRVQLIEASFYPEVLRDRFDDGWVDALLRDLRRPGLPVNSLGAVGWRLRRTYLWIYGTILVAWVGKLDAGGAFSLDPGELLQRAAVGSVPGWTVVSLVAALYAWLIALALAAHRNYPKGDDEHAETTPIEP